MEYATMTEKQFVRIAGYMIKDGAKHADEIMHILENGELPESDDMDEAEMIAKLAALLTQLKGSPSSDTDSGI